MYKNLNIEQILCLLQLDFKIRQNTPYSIEGHKFVSRMWLVGQTRDKILKNRIARKNASSKTIIFPYVSLF